MADAKIVNIKGVQWNLKDEVARNEVAEIKTKIITEEKVLETRGESFVSLITINNIKFVQIHLAGNIQISSIGENIFSFAPIEGQKNIIRSNAILDKIDYTGRIAAGVQINLNGTISVFPILENKYEGTVTHCRVYGDCFLKVS